MSRAHDTTSRLRSTTRRRLSALVHRSPIQVADFPIATAIRRSFKQGYTLARLRQDVLAGLVVGIVALPLSMALAIAVGAPPQHGLYTAIVAGIVVALTGGAKLKVTGPTAAFIVILAPILGKYGLSGLLTAGLMAGVLLVAIRSRGAREARAAFHGTPDATSGLMWKKHEEKVPAIEPPCPECVEARSTTGRPDALCARHAEKHAHAHVYHYHREHPFRTHDSNVTPTGTDPRR